MSGKLEMETLDANQENAKTNSSQKDRILPNQLEEESQDIGGNCRKNVRVKSMKLLEDAVSKREREKSVKKVGGHSF